MMKLLPQFLRPESNPSLMTFEGWDEWESDYRRQHPVKFAVYEGIPRFFGRTVNRVRNCWWAVRHRIDPRHRYHVVRTGLRPGYYDKDDQMLHACFALLADFVEHEHPEGFVGLSGEGGNGRPGAMSEAGDLYRWWKEYRAAGKSDREMEQRQLHRLIDVRPHLWT